ncbi:hypothetical protein D3C80_796440 [compost metagenome]
MGLYIKLRTDRSGEVQRHFKFFAQPTADVQFDLFPFQRLDIQRAVSHHFHRPTAGQRRLPLRRQRTLRGFHIEIVQLDMLILGTGLQQQAGNQHLGITGQAQLFPADLLNRDVQRQADFRQIRQQRLGEQLFQRFAQRLLFRHRCRFRRLVDLFTHFFRDLDSRLYRLRQRVLRGFRQCNQQAADFGGQQGQRTLLPLRSGTEFTKRDCRVVYAYLNVIQRQHTQGNRVRRAQISGRLAGLFHRRRRRHFFGFHHHVDVLRGQRIDAQRTVFKAGQIE